MSRIKLEMPARFSFTCSISVRITDINYGNHAGNDAILGMVHEARMQYLSSLGFTELQFAGHGMIMADAGIEFKAEAFYGETLQVLVQPANPARIGFDLYYRLEKIINGQSVTVALAKTGMICYDYTAKKIIPLADEARKALFPEG